MNTAEHISTQALQSAESIFKDADLKSTASRLAVVTVLTKNNFPLTHQGLLKQLADDFDRVTLYRVLDWLLQHHVIHRIAGEDRAWRFQLNASSAQTTSTNDTKRYSSGTVPSSKKMLNQHSHAHFECSECGKIFCLDDFQPKLSSSIPAQFTVDSIELNIKGKCAECN